MDAINQDSHEVHARPRAAASSPNLGAAAHPLNRVVRVMEIIQFVCDEFEVSLIELTSDRRSQFIVRPRHIGFWLCKELTRASLPEIGRKFGGRDHTTIMHGVRKIQEHIADKRPLGILALELRAKLTGNA